MGEEGGKGTGSHGSEGRELQYAMRGPQDQAWLSRDPVGAALWNEGPAFNTEWSREVVGAEGGAIGVAPREELVAPVVGPPARLVKLMPVAAPGAIARGEVEERPISSRPVEDVVAAVVVGAEASAARAPAESREKTEARGGKSAAGPVADAAPESDSESDAFARIGSVVFKNGKLDVRLGRKVKTVRPLFTIKGGLDRISIVNPVTVVMVTVGETGKVSDVRVIRSSGSNELDLPWVLAVYKWWFEPAKDEGGKAVGDVVQLRLGVVEREF
jgi:TonB family protein